MESLTIGEVAKRAGVGIETIRFYERKGLIEDPPRKWSGYRQYPETTIDRLRFIRKAKELGFTLHEINELLELRYDPALSCDEVREKAKLKIKDMEEKIHTLQKMKKALMKLTDACDGSGLISQCPILEALEQGERE